MATHLIDPKQLKRVRSHLGYTQAKLAAVSGVSQSIIAKLEAGKVDPSFSTLQALSKALNAEIGTKGKTAGQVMSSPVIGVQQEARLSECVEIMKKRSISQMPVFSGHRLMGSISEGHVMSLAAGSPDPVKVLKMSVKEHMLPVFAVVGTDTPVDALYSLFRFMPAVLVSSGGEVVGIVTKIDVLAGTGG